ncbi:MAG: signal recognition particle receptor subunit alpha, partial [Burkholderiaceae bacterium]
MFNFFKKKPPAPVEVEITSTAKPPAQSPVGTPISTTATPAAATSVVVATEPPRKAWLDKLKAGLRKTGSSIAVVFTGTQIDDALYEDLEAALLMADTGTAATQFLLDDLKRRVKESKTTEPQAVKGLLIEALADLLKPLEKPLTIGVYKPTVIMVAGV